MNTLNRIEFVLRGRVDGVDLTPRTIGLSQFNEFNQQVEAFIAGSQKGKLNETHVEVGEGSYKLTVLLAAVAAASLEPDLVLLAREDTLGELDPKRAEVIAKWQVRARTDSALQYEINPDRVDLPKVRLSNSSNFRVGAVVPWVSVEKYLFGTITDMGGAQKANVHLRLKDTGQTIIINAAQDYLQELPDNRLYHPALAHVKAQQHYRTGTLRNVQLIALEEYAPVYDEAALDRFAERGREAWRDVPDAAAWVREQRGGV
jgi:hypothetical protein